MTVLNTINGGNGDSVFLFIHGMGTTSAVWRPLLKVVEEKWQGAWTAPDLRGHGQSPRMPAYDIEGYARDIEDTLAAAGMLHRDLTIVGHSLGGVVGLKLANGNFGFKPARVLGLGIKVNWKDGEIEAIQQRANAPVKHWPDIEEALTRYRKASGLLNLDSNDPVLLDGVIQDDKGWRLAADPKTAGLGKPPSFQAMTDETQCAYHLACGAEDSMVSRDELRVYDPNAEVLDGLGHNAMVQAPQVVWEWIRRHAQS